jgi:alkylation response protein AidB-like acyl-CoA dehydrogenase
VAVNIEDYATECRAWLKEHLRPRDPEDTRWGEGSDDVSVFHDLTFEEERPLLDRLMAWHHERFDAGYGAITWPAEYGGAGLSADHERVYRREEGRFEAPEIHETFSVTVGLIAPTVRLFGSDEQRRRFVRPFLRAEELCCQLFSEPGAGSDLAGLATRAVRDGDEWVINGQKVWSSGAQFSQWGELIARTDPDVPKHAGMTSFLVPMDATGVEIRPIRQMSGGSSFNEVFLTDVRLPDSLRLGDTGAGWKVALATLGFERGDNGGGGAVGGTWLRLLALARHMQKTSDPVIRQQLAAVYTHQELRQFNIQRFSAAAANGQPPGAEGSISKLMWARGMTEMGNVASALLGPRIAADTGEWGTFAWTGQLLGAPGYRIAGGSDEVQHNIIAERVLGLPGEPRVDRDVPWRDVPR